MLFGIVFALAVASVPLAGGHLLALADIRLRATWLLMTAIGGQILIVSVLPGGSETLHDAVHVGSYLLVGLWVVVNRRLPWIWLVALGGVLNFVAITANGGVMPADPHALAAAGLVLNPGEFTNSAAIAHPHLLFLGDVFWIPKGLPAANVFSVGDVVILLGMILALHCICGSRAALRRFAVL